MYGDIHMNSLSFKQRVCNVIINCANDFKSTFLDYEYLIYSDAFAVQPFYIISAKAGNYKHLTGVNSAIAPYDFFEMCLNGTLIENDFDFIKPNESEVFVKGVVRNKIIALPSISNLFFEALIAEENFVNGKVNCTLATSDNKITVGFENRINARIKTLLRGNEIKSPKAVDVTLVLRRNRGLKKFDTIIQGACDNLLDLVNELL